VRNVPESRLPEFFQRIQELFADFEAAVVEPAAPHSRNYALTVVFYPSFYLDDSQQSAVASQE
jgi:hypothetical protein